MILNEAQHHRRRTLSTTIRAVAMMIAFGTLPVPDTIISLTPVAMAAPLKAKVNKSKAPNRVLEARREAKAARLAEFSDPKSDAAVRPTSTTWSRQQVLNADPERLEAIGHHLIVGYYSLKDVAMLAKRRAIAGVFITDHNVARRPVATVRKEIDYLQYIRRVRGLPPLIVAADQEGGSVSRLSPPLKRRPSLGKLVSALKTDDERKTAVEAYATEQAEELKALGVTLNFAPVVDLKFNPGNRRDGVTRLRLRAISNEPGLVAKIAGWYCDALAKAKVMCTLKHFPGLGRVTRDTHVSFATLDTSTRELTEMDWIPFRSVMARPHVATMLAHVRLPEIDKEQAASYSEPVIAGLIRGTWAHDGLIITDDFSMGAVTRSPDGIGGAAVKALNAGADLVLVSFNEKHFDSLMGTLLGADAAGQIDRGDLSSSLKRINRFLAQSR